MTDLGIATESAADARLLQTLVDRVLVDAVDWIEPEVLKDYRSWRGVGGPGWLDLHEAYGLARTRGLRIYGHFNGSPGADDAHMHRAVLLLFAEEEAPPAAVVIARDLDHEQARAHGFEQAVGAGQWPFVVVGALAEPEIEAWLIAAWVPENSAELEIAASVRAKLGFDPCARPEQLTSTARKDPKDAKRVLHDLTSSGRNAAARWADAPIERLESNGARCGLAKFLGEVQARLVPVVSGVSIP